MVQGAIGLKGAPSRTAPSGVSDVAEGTLGPTRANVDSIYCQIPPDGCGNVRTCLGGALHEEIS
jgi:hypothetical protein